MTAYSEVVCSGFNSGIVYLGSVHGGQAINIAETRKSGEVIQEKNRRSRYRSKLKDNKTEGGASVMSS